MNLRKVITICGILLFVLAPFAPLASANHWLELAPYKTVASVSQSQADNGPTGAARTINKSQSYIWTAGEDVTNTGCTQPLTVQSTLQIPGGDILGVRKDGTVTLSNAGGSFQNVTLLRHVNTSANNFFFQIQFDINGGVGTTTATQRNTWSGSCASHLPSPWYAWSDSAVASGNDLLCTGNSPNSDAIVENTSAVVSITREKVCFQFAPANNGAIGWLQYTSEQPAVPTAPVLSSIISGTPQRCVLVWTTPLNPSPALQGYNLTRTNEYGGVDIISLGLVNTYSDIPHTRAWNYTVHAWNAVGNSTESNQASCMLAAQDFTGQNGILYGGDRSGEAAAFGISTTALDLLLALLLIVICSGALAIAIRPAPLVGGAVGATIGFFLTIALGLIPIWVVFFFLILAGAVIMVVRLRSGSEGGSV